ncbi:hypothetical protein [Ideonella sp. BN130291]|uniref:hypothetical protein n=1 Tax=Ideonella sp. BN130291 TaxID=3112940 RepID=UPI002E26EF5D|nr:hypothetical protein [Ideonella sp. BN130291]
MVTVTLTLHDSEGTLAASVTGEFDDDDVDRLRDFATQMTRVKETALLARGFSGITNMKWEAGSGMVFTCAPYSNAELYELLHVLRPVILEEERTSFQKIIALLGRRFKDKTFAHHARSLRHIFEEGELSSYMQVQVGGQKLLHNSILKLWLNGTQYHTDQEKAESWKKLEDSLTENNARALAIELVHSRVKALLLLDHVVQLVLSKA